LPLVKDRGYKIAFEPGRYISANAGIILTRVLYRKKGGEKNFVVIDAGMNDLIRPTLYEAYHHIWPAKPSADNIPPGKWSRNFEPRNGEVVDVVGPICESGDYLATARPLPTTKRGDLLAVFTAGAYGFAMSSNYNNPPPRRRGAGGRRELQNHPQTRDTGGSGGPGARVARASCPCCQRHGQDARATESHFFTHFPLNSELSLKLTPSFSMVTIVVAAGVSGAVSSRLILSPSI
jgi:hypothetical protein